MADWPEACDVSDDEHSDFGGCHADDSGQSDDDLAGQPTDKSVNDSVQQISYPNPCEADGSDDEDDDHAGLSPLDLVFTVVLDERMQEEADTTRELDDPWWGITCLQSAKGTPLSAALKPNHDTDDEPCAFYSSGGEDEEDAFGAGGNNEDPHGLYSLYQLAADTNGSDWRARRQERIEARAREDWQEVQALARVALHHHSPFLTLASPVATSDSLHCDPHPPTLTPAAPVAPPARTEPPPVLNPRRQRSPPPFRLAASSTVARRPPAPGPPGQRAPGSARRASALLEGPVFQEADDYTHSGPPLAPTESDEATRAEPNQPIRSRGSSVVSASSDEDVGISLVVPTPFQMAVPVPNCGVGAPGLVRAHRASLASTQAADWKEILQFSDADASIARARRDREVAAQFKAAKERERIFNEVMASLNPVLPAALVPPTTARRASQITPPLEHLPRDTPKAGVPNGPPYALRRMDSLRRSDGPSATINGEKVKLRPIFGGPAAPTETRTDSPADGFPSED